MLTLTAISVLSSFTHGQSRLALEVLEEAVALRTQEDQSDDKDPVLQKQDVLNAIAIMYERADVIPEKLTKAKSGKSKEREKRKAAKIKKKSSDSST
jgi:DNA-binding protein H-NS